MRQRLPTLRLLVIVFATTAAMLACGPTLSGGAISRAEVALAGMTPKTPAAISDVTSAKAYLKKSLELRDRSEHAAARELARKARAFAKRAQDADAGKVTP